MPLREISFPTWRNGIRQLFKDLYGRREYFRPAGSRRQIMYSPASQSSTLIEQRILGEPNGFEDSGPAHAPPKL
jgi:hypothetical protein